MRAFIAIDIPAKIRAGIGELMAALKPAADNVRWSRPEGIHVTLKFLGQAEPARVEQVKQSLSRIHLEAPLELAVRGAGYFPTERSPRVIWLGIQAGPELARLAAFVEESLMPLGFEKENRPYSPHLTIGRVNSPGKIAAVQELLQRRAPLEFGSFTSNEFFLYESKPSSGGSVYNKIARFVIAPEAPASRTP